VRRSRSSSCFASEIKGARINGAARWLTPSKALIQLSLRHRWSDIVWFTFFHELGHVLIHSKKDTFINDKGPHSGVEQEADAFAAQTLIPRRCEADLAQLATTPDVERFAAEIGIAPGSSWAGYNTTSDGPTARATTSSSDLSSAAEPNLSSRLTVLPTAMLCVGSVPAKSQLVVAEIFEVAVGAAGFVAGQAADAPVDGLPFEAMTGCLDFGDNVAPREFRGAGALVELIDGVEDGVSAAQTGAGVGELGLQRWDGDGGSVDGVVAVRIV
jgi:hypothetical protein